jgi:signal transduction histidine kinase
MRITADQCIFPVYLEGHGDRRWAVPKRDTVQLDRQFGRRVLALVLAGFIAVLAAGSTALLVMIRGQDQAMWVDHTWLVESHVGGIRLALEEMRSARRGLLLKLPSVTPATYAAAQAHLDREIGAFTKLTQDNPAQQANAAEMRRRAADLDRLFHGLLSGQVASDVPGEPHRQAVAAGVQQVAEQMLAAERKLLVRRQQDARASVETFYFVLGLTAVLLVFVGAASVMVILRYTRDLTQTRDDLRGLNANLEGAVQDRTRDLQRANDEIQRFAYIVSHDLRSPLVNVMGFTAELEASAKPLAALIAAADEQAPGLVSPDARAAVMEDLPESVGFIRNSTQKMDRLINAILRLSREGRRTLSPERVALTPLVESIVGGIRHLIDDRGAAVQVQAAMPTLFIDRLAVEQILSNLIENALKYLHPGRPGEIRVSAEMRGSRVLIHIADNGRGIDPRDHERIFDLFRRSGMQDQPGEGIGLAHVRALAYRLGGIVSVGSKLGEGATFTVDFPAKFEGEKDGGQ